MNPNAYPPVQVQRLSSLIAIYEAAFATMLADQAPLATDSVDPVFAQLRSHQQRHWPEGSAALDELGACACDLLQAAESGGSSSPAFVAALQQHQLALAQLRSQLAQWPELARRQTA